MKQKKPWYKNWIVWVAIIIVLGVIGMFMPKNDKEQTTPQEAVVESAAPEETEEVSEPEAETTLADLVAKTNETNAPQTAQMIIDDNPEVVEAIVNNDGEKNILVIHAEYPDGGWSNENRIKNTMFLVEDIVKDYNGTDVDELQFWATEPLQNSITGESTGQEKVISFTIGNDAMKGIINGVTYGSNMMEKDGVLQDLWIHPALLQN